MKSNNRINENTKIKRRGKMLVEAITLGLLIYGAYRLYEKFEEKEQKKKNEPKLKTLSYIEKIKEIEETYYPQYLSYNLYLESNIRKLPNEAIAKLEKKYTLIQNKPIINFGDFKYDSKFRELLKKRMEQEPEIVRLIPDTGSVLVNFDYFLNKKAELEAKRIIDNLTSNLQLDGGKNE